MGEVLLTTQKKKNNGNIYLQKLTVPVHIIHKDHSRRPTLTKFDPIFFILNFSNIYTIGYHDLSTHGPCVSDKSYRNIIRIQLIRIL